jgi:DNA-binding LacI/PurR family transcriptional regulator
MTEAPPILALVSDLIFSSKITAEARAAGATVTIVRDPKLLGDRPGGMLIVDLNLARAIPAAAAWRAATGGRVIGFVGHTDQATITQAREAGIDQVMARSQFVQALPALLGRNT